MIRHLIFFIISTIVVCFNGNIHARQRDKTTEKTVTDSCKILLSLEISDLACNGSNNGFIKAQVKGGTSPFMFSIDNGQNFQPLEVFENLSPGDYMVLVRDEKQCVVQTSAIVQDPPPLFIDLGADLTIISDDVIKLDAGTGYASYVWSTGETSQTITFSKTTDEPVTESLWVTVTDKNGCIGSSATLKITISPQKQSPELSPEPETKPAQEPELKPDSEAFPETIGSQQ
jgi:hypothetical protein